MWYLHGGSWLKGSGMLCTIFATLWESRVISTHISISLSPTPLAHLRGSWGFFCVLWVQADRSAPICSVIKVKRVWEGPALHMSALPKGGTRTASHQVARPSSHAGRPRGRESQWSLCTWSEGGKLEIFGKYHDWLTLKQAVSYKTSCGVVNTNSGPVHKKFEEDLCTLKNKHLSP